MKNSRGGVLESSEDYYNSIGLQLFIQLIHTSNNNGVAIESWKTIFTSKVGGAQIKGVSARDLIVSPFWYKYGGRIIAESSRKNKVYYVDEKSAEKMGLTGRPPKDKKVKILCFGKNYKVTMDPEQNRLKQKDYLGNFEIFFYFGRFTCGNY